MVLAKTRTYAVPNVLQAGCSMVITDPKAEILRKTGAFLLAQGYEVRVFDLIDPSASFCYNPFCYVQSVRTFLQLIADLIQNTTPPNAHENDPFWSKAETRSAAGTYALPDPRSARRRAKPSPWSWR